MNLQSLKINLQSLLEEVTIFKMNLQIKTIYKLQLIQNKKTNTTYLEDRKTKLDSSDPLHELLQLQICKWNALLHLKTMRCNVQMRNPRGPTLILINRGTRASYLPCWQLTWRLGYARASMNKCVCALLLRRARPRECVLLMASLPLLRPSTSCTCPKFILTIKNNY